PVFHWSRTVPVVPWFCLWFCGSYLEALIEVGVKLAFTTQGGYTTANSNPYELNRYAVFPWITLSQFKAYLNN
ncbi:polysaccharide deacetylase family protein, partial [Alkaliphilus serpentinus]|uniref:hypothetical protein n=1 Tax=Alkaliphilus serpentinus TaxID=1482731 RepID=UPI001A9AC560